MSEFEQKKCLENHRKMSDTSNIRFVNATMVKFIIENRGPKGLFIQKEAGKFIGIDNSMGKARREEFATKFGCLDWLTGELPADAIRRRERQRRETCS